MEIPRRRFLHLAAGAAALPAVSRIAQAQSYPTRPITMIVAFPAGGGADAIGRILAERMRASLGQPVVIENVTGAGGTIGVGRLARAANDGYTVALGDWGTFVANGVAYTLPYNLLTDFEPNRTTYDASPRECREENHAGRRSQESHRLVEGLS